MKTELAVAHIHLILTVIEVSKRSYEKRKAKSQLTIHYCQLLFDVLIKCKPDLSAPLKLNVFQVKGFHSLLESQSGFENP